MSNVIPTVSTMEINLSNDGLKNLAGWIARYVKLEKIDHGGFSEEMILLINQGILTKFEPTLKNYEKAPYDDGIQYKNSVYLLFSIILNLLMEDERYLDLKIVFQEDGKCTCYLDEDGISSTEEQEQNAFYEKGARVLNSIGFFKDSQAECSWKEVDGVEFSWKEVDAMILKFIQIEKNKPQGFPVVPAEKIE